MLDSVSSLAISPLSDQLRLRLLAATRLIPGVHTSASAARLSLHARPESHRGVVFDRRTGRLLGGRPGAPGTIIAQGVVGSLGAPPHGVRPIPARHLPPPPAPTLTPATGSADTVFTLTLPAAAVGSVAAPRVLALMAGPTGPGCHYQYSKPGVAQIRTGTSNGSTDTFAVSPTVIERSSWCAGRYGLQIAVGSNPALGTGQGSTLYFIVH